MSEGEAILLLVAAICISGEIGHITGSFAWGWIAFGGFALVGFVD